MSWKNKLQEYCQTQGCPLPAYTSVPLTNNNIIVFRSKVLFVIHGISREYYGTTCSRKKDAEMSAAEVAYKSITNYDAKFTKLQVIDLENVPYHKKHFYEDVLYVGIIGSIHPALNKYSDWYRPSTRDLVKESTISNKLLYTIEGGYKNLVDHILSMFMVSVAEYIRVTDEVVSVRIVTSDNAGLCTRSCLLMECQFLGILEKLKVTISR